MTSKANKISSKWIRETRKAFRDFLDETNFPDPERLGERARVQVPGMVDHVHCVSVGKTKDQNILANS